MKNTHHTKGSILIFSIIITAILTSIGIAFASILEKEARKQIYASRSQVALNIANSALECTLYNDFRRQVFDYSLFSVPKTFDCGDLYKARNNDDWNTRFTPVTSDNTYEYEIIANDGIGDIDSSTSRVPCARVKVIKGAVSSIEIKGYDRCSQGDEAQRDLVRRFKITY